MLRLTPVTAMRRKPTFVKRAKIVLQMQKIVSIAIEADLSCQCEGRIRVTPKRTLLMQDFHGHVAEKILLLNATNLGGLSGRR
jgi:hypothetical protein